MQHPVNGARAASAVTAVVAACALFGTTGTVLEQRPSGATGLGVGASRLLVGGVTLAAVAAWQRPAGGRDWARHTRSSLAGGVMVAVYQLAFFAATRRTGVALGTVVTIASGPVFAGLIGWWRHRHVPARAWSTGTALSIIGVAALVLAGREGASADALGIAAALLSGLGYATYATIAKSQMDAGLDPAGSMAALFLTAGVLTSPVLALQPMAWLPSARGLLVVGHLGVVSVGLAYTLYGRGLRRLPTPTVVTLTLVEPVTAALLSVTVLHDRLSPVGWSGIAVVLVGLWVTARPSALAVPEGALLPIEEPTHEPSHEPIEGPDAGTGTVRG